MTDTYLERFRDVADPRLGRHVNHDDQSRRYAVAAPAGVGLRPVRHERHVPVFDQGNLGSCTGNAAVGCLATGAFFGTVDESDAVELRGLDQAAAVHVYSRASAIDPFRGQYPPDDTGSDGLSVAKVLHAAGAISGYRHAFGIGQVLAALMDVPVITGTVWRKGMYQPNGDGVVQPTGAAEGGHEYIVDEYVPAGAPYGPGGVIASEPMVGCTNSWGPGWGVEGRFYMTVAGYTTLLADRGDVTVFVPCTQPAPQPSGPADPDAELASALRSWSGNTAAASSKKARRAVAAWISAKGL